MLLTGCQAKLADQNTDTIDDSISTSICEEVPACTDDRALFNLRGPIKTMTEKVLGSEEEASFSEYNFNKNGRIVYGVDCGFSFTIDYLANPDGVYTKISDYDGMEDEVITLKRNKDGKIINWGVWNHETSTNPKVKVLKYDGYGNPLIVEASGNDGHDWPEPDSGNYTEKTVYEYEYDDYGNWTLCSATTTRHFLKPQTTFSGDPCDQDEIIKHTTQRKHVYFTN